MPPLERMEPAPVTEVMQVEQVKCEPEVPLPPKGESAVTEVKRLLGKLTVITTPEPRVEVEIEKVLELEVVASPITMPVG